MPLDAADQALLSDIRLACEHALDFVKGASHTAYLKDLKTQRAVERELEILGEASRALSEPAKAQFKDVPWKAIIGLRNVLAHNYGRVDPNRIWETVQQELPPLKKRLEKGKH